MAGKFHHEELYRGAEKLAKLGELRVVLCGAGALGSNLADNLSRQGFSKLTVIDHDRVEEHNVSTQLYGESDIGVWKVEALRNRIFRAAGIEIEAVRKELTQSNAHTLLKNAGIILDLFDNSASRKLVQEQSRAQKTPCLHVGLYADYCEVIWDAQYRVPKDAAGDVCDYPLARNLVLFATAIATETLMRFAIDGVQESWSATLGDFAVRPFE
jgi:molybdopterin/thiamine biosynthesis adenylyltransferase